MLRLRGLAVVVLLTASSLLTLRLMGLSQWIQAILIIAVELSLGVLLHEMLENRDRREAARRPLVVRVVAPPIRRTHRRRTVMGPPPDHGPFRHPSPGRRSAGTDEPPDPRWPLRRGYRRGCPG
jgi:hypothetical protein